MEMKYDYSSLRNFVTNHKEWYLDKYGCLDWKWFDEGLVWAIEDYLSSKAEFTEDDVVFLKENGFVSEDFIEED